MSSDVELKEIEEERFPCRIMSWNEIQNACETVADKVRHSGFYPDVIIGISRGGWVPARILADCLVIKHLYSLKTEHWGLTATKDGKAELTQGLNVDIKGKNVLVMDDITDSGESLMLALDHIKELGPKEVKTGTVLHIDHSKYTPDFYDIHVESKNWTWIIFPWNLHEDLRSILPKTLTVPRDKDGIQGAFMDQFKVDVGMQHIEETMEELVRTGHIMVDGGKASLLEK